MATISITVPDAVLNRVVDGICAKYDYTNKKINGETKNQFAKRMAARLIARDVRNYELGQALKTNAAAMKTLSTSIDTDLAGVS